jgi:hypothetical protein
MSQKCTNNQTWYLTEEAAGISLNILTNFVDFSYIGHALCLAEACAWRDIMAQGFTVRGPRHGPAQR